MARTKKSYQARDVRPKHIRRFRGIAIPEPGANKPDAFVDESFNAISRKLRLLETRVGHIRALSSSVSGVSGQSIFSGDIHNVLSLPRVIVLAEGSRVWFETRDPSPNRVLNTDQFVGDPVVPFLDPPNITEECDADRNCINHPPPVGSVDIGAPVGVGVDSGMPVSPGSERGNPNINDTLYPPFDSDGGDPAQVREGAKWVCKNRWIELPFITSTSYLIEFQYALDQHDYQEYGIKYTYSDKTENIQVISKTDLKDKFIINVQDYPDPKSGGTVVPVALIRICKYDK